MSCDPRAFGARCDECPLRDFGPPVPPVVGASAGGIGVMGDAPNADAVMEGEPLAGRDAELLEQVLNVNHVERHDITVLNAIGCRPPENKLDEILTKVKKENAKRRREWTAALKASGKAGLPPPALKLIPTPQEACLPWTVHTLRSLNALITVGAIPTKVMLGEKVKPSKVAGSLMDGGWDYQPGLGIRFVQLEQADDHLPAGLEPLRLVPTLHPGFVLRKPRYLKPFRKDLGTAIDWFYDRITFTEPSIDYHPSAAALHAFLFGSDAVFAFDVETDGIEATRARMRCIAIGNAEHVKVIGIRPKDLAASGPVHCPSCEGRGRTPAISGPRCHQCGGTGRPPGEVSPWYTVAELADVLDVVRAWLVSSRMKIGHNAGYYDYLNILGQLGVATQNILDTILEHRLVESELPHNLGFVVRMWAPATRAWKADREGQNIAVNAESDLQLHAYCAKDVAYDEKVALPLFEAAKLRGQAHLLPLDHKVQEVCRGLHLIGMHVDIAEAKKVEATLTTKLIKERDALREIAAKEMGVAPEKHNPGSIYQLADLWFDKWGLIPPVKPGDKDKYRTKSGMLSTSDVMVRALLRLPHLKDYQRAYLLGTRRYRKVAKLLGTYVSKLRPRSEVYQAGWDEDSLDIEWDEDLDEDALLRYSGYVENKGFLEKGIIWEDGRLRTGYNAHVTVVGRLSSSRPWNAQNCPKWLRRLITPAPGHCFVGADFGQLHLRIAASLWQIALYLDAFDAGKDPHSMVTAVAIFGDDFMQADGWPCAENGWEWSGNAKKMRNIAKVIQYASIYRAGDSTVYEVFTKTENKKGDLMYLHYTLPDVAQMKAAWLAGVPEVPVGWDNEERLFRQNGFLADPIVGRRRDFLDGPTPQDLANARVLMSETGLVNPRMVELVERIPFFKWGHGTGLLTQTHDAMVIECPADGVYKENGRWLPAKGTPAWEAWHVLHETFNFEHPQLPGVKIVGEPSIAFDWSATG